MCLGGTWYSLLSDIICKENVPSKHPITLKTFLKFICCCFVSSVLAPLSCSQLVPGIKFSISLLFTVGMKAVLLFKFKLLPVFEHFSCCLFFAWLLSGHVFVQCC